VYRVSVRRHRKGAVRVKAIGDFMTRLYVSQTGHPLVCVKDSASISLSELLRVVHGRTSSMLLTA
jgi:hypothetical protein